MTETFRIDVSDLEVLHNQVRKIDRLVDVLIGMADRSQDEETLLFAHNLRDVGTIITYIIENIYSDGDDE